MIYLIIPERMLKPIGEWVLKKLTKMCENISVSFFCFITLSLRQ